VCHELNKSSKCHELNKSCNYHEHFADTILHLIIQSSHCGGMRVTNSTIYRNVTNLMSHLIVMSTLRTLSFVSEHESAIVEVRVSRTQRVISKCHKLNESCNCHELLTDTILYLRVQSSHCGGTCVTNLTSHRNVTIFSRMRSFPYLRYKAALVEVRVLRTSNFIRHRNVTESLRTRSFISDTEQP